MQKLILIAAAAVTLCNAAIVYNPDFLVLDTDYYDFQLWFAFDLGYETLYL